MDAIDPDRSAPGMVTLAAHLELRQLARSICRQRAKQEEGEAAQSALFDDQLQKRYPATRGGEEVYILREYMTLPERAENISRLRREAASKSRHADALQAETDSLLAMGRLASAA